jgi:hypothetical protein
VKNNAVAAIKMASSMILFLSTLRALAAVLTANENSKCRSLWF